MKTPSKSAFKSMNKTRVQGVGKERISIGRAGALGPEDIRIPGEGDAVVAPGKMHPQSAAHYANAAERAMRRK
jgi:hypothetical protein